MASKNFKEIRYEEKNKSFTVFPDVCKSCGYCIEKCPVKCLSFDSENKNYLGNACIKCDIEKCISCKTCENACPDCAIIIENKK